MAFRYCTFIAAVSGILLPGCAVGPFATAWPEPRPLGRDIPTYKSASNADKDIPDAQEEPTGALKLSQAFALALMRNPRLASFSWEVRAAEARQLQASLLPNPEAMVDIEEFSGDRRSFREVETTVAIGQRLLLAGKRAKRTRLAGFKRDLAAWDYESKRLDVLTEVIRAFVAILGAQREVELSEETVRIAQRVAATAANRVQAGAGSPVEQTRAEVALSSAQNQLRQARQVLQAGRVRLAALWGSSEPQFNTAEGVLDIDVGLPPLTALTERLSQNPELMRAAVSVTTRQAALELEKAKAVPDLTVYAGYRRVEADSANTFVAGLAIPLPIFDRNQGGIREAEANLSRARWGKKAAESAVYSALAEAYSSLANAIEQRRAFKEDILPGASSAFEAIREGYEQGKFDYLNLLTAQQTLAQKRVDYVHTLVRLRDAAAQIERLVGEPLTTETTSPRSEKEVK